MKQDQTAHDRGLFITFEGGEGSGKSTQIRLLAAHLEGMGHPAIITREPGGTPFAERIRDVILIPGLIGTTDDAMTQALLFAAARREHIRALIEPALAAGTTVLCDRYTDSTRAYQGGRMPIDALETTLQLATGGLKPDITFLLDLPPEAGLARARARNAATDTFERADLAFHEAVRARFLALAEAEPGRIVVIDAMMDKAEVAGAIRLVLDARRAMQAG